MPRIETLINREWLFCRDDKREFAQRPYPEHDFEQVNLPHSNTLLPFNYFSERRTQFISWYRKHLPVHERPEQSRVLIDFDGVMMISEVFVNGKHVLTHHGGYTGFTADVTDFMDPAPGADNVLAVRVDSRLHPDIPPCGKVMDYQTFGGIYRDVRMRVVPACFISDVFVTTPEPLAPRRNVKAQVVLSNTGNSDFAGRVDLKLLNDAGRELAVTPSQSCTVAAGSEQTIELLLQELEDIALWELDVPVLYRAQVTVTAQRHIHDRTCVRFGFRDAEFDKDESFKFNGRAVKLLGLNRHQTYPYVGAAAPARLQRKDADILKFELGCNIVRTSHYPQSPHFLDRCDEIGLLVFEEIPGWGHIGDAAWKELCCRDVQDMVRRDRNHPSIILWGVRINESADDHELYVRTNNLARELDPSRPTGGVRWGVESEFLEDVFTANDYGYKPPENVINEPPVTPYLITEYGCLDDTRRTASTGTLVKAAMIHADIVNAAMGNHKVAGAIGWCAFDYHSQDWITIDGIQPWGVADAFRFPKIPAALYASQMDPADRIVLEAGTRWKVGDQAGFDPNENTMKGGHDAPMVVFSNCDSVQVWVGDEKRGTFEPARERFRHLTHPPFFCNGIGRVWGPSWQELRIIGYLGDTAVAEQRFPATNDARRLELRVDDAELVADGTDATRVLLLHTDEFGNIQPHSRTVVTLTVDGPAILIGPNPCALVGGVTGLYLRAGTQRGQVNITASAPELGCERQASVKVR